MTSADQPGGATTDGHSSGGYPAGNPAVGNDAPQDYAAPGYSAPSYPAAGSTGEPWSGPRYGPTAPTAAYSANDFPAPAGVAELGRQPFGPGVDARRKRRLAPLLVAASLSAVIGAGAGVGSYAYLTDGTGGTASSISVTTVPASQNPPLGGTIAATVNKIQPSVVTITVRSGQSGDIGTGVVLDDSGHILTNDHVVSPATQPGAGSSITVTFHDGTTAKATVVGTSSTNDLAVLKVNRVANLQPAVFAKSSSIQVGQTVVAAGAPLGLSGSVTSGIVSNTARPVRSGDNNDAVYLAVQTDAAINPGNSGGPLVDLNGSVVGINSSIASTGSGSGGGQAGNIGIGFAIPSDVAARVAGELIRDGRSVNAALGVRVGGTGSELSTATGVPLQAVVGGGAAERAGLQPGDVVTKLNDFPTPTADSLIAATRFYAPGTEVTVTYTRDGGAAQTVKATLGTQ